MPDETQPELRRLVQQFMMHHENHLSVPYSRCNRNGKCQYGFPEPIIPITSLDKYGRFRYRQRNTQSAMVVTHIPAFLQLLQCHCHADIVSEISVFMYLYKYLFKGVNYARFQILAENSLADEIRPDEFHDYINA